MEWAGKGLNIYLYVHCLFTDRLQPSDDLRQLHSALYILFVCVFGPLRDTEEVIHILTWICSIFKHEYRRNTLTAKHYNYHKKKKKTSLHDDSTPVALLALKMKTLFH